MPLGVCRHCQRHFIVKPALAGTAKYCSKECKDAAARTVPMQVCKCCGREFKPNGHKIFCDKACGYAFRAGMSREEWLEEHPQNDSSTLFKRKCHTCGRIVLVLRMPGEAAQRLRR